MLPHPLFSFFNQEFNQREQDEPQQQLQQLQQP
jgi:hypothetical protein